MKRKALLSFLIFTMLAGICFVGENKTVNAYVITPENPEDFTIILFAELNETTKNNLTAVFYFDNDTINEEFLHYFNQRLELIRHQVSGILAFPVEKITTNSTTIYPVFENASSSNFYANLEQTEKSARLLGEEWFISWSLAGFFPINEEEGEEGIGEILKNPVFLVSVFANFSLFALYLKKRRE
ncbi:MAG: hypothetical protein Q6356_007185 [Candidatus Wukongarchaeota archaeon]|jgi:hypothetical protein|nr:hypothetical protein [Candidatus Wukongarchaeota archaeon]